MENTFMEIDSLSVNCRFPLSKKAQSRIFQFVESVRDFSSQYGCDNGIAYTAYNVTGRPTIFPKLGDDAKAYMMKTYGTWWKNLPSAKFTKLSTVIPHGYTTLSQDFIEVQYKIPVYPCELHLYETYNPGALVRVLCFHYETNQWKILWSDKPKSRKLSGSKAFISAMYRLRWINFKTDLYRLEFHHQHLEYYSELDAIELGGYEEEPHEDEIDLNKKIKPFNYFMYNDLNDYTQDKFCAIDKMPIEVLRLIFSYLDIETLCIAAQVSRSFKNLCYDPVLYNVLNLQPFWHKITSSTLTGFQSRCTSLEKLSLAWCGDHQRISPKDFIEFVENACSSLSCLKLSNCHFIDSSSLKAIAKTCSNLKILDISYCDNKKLCTIGFSQIAQLNHLIYLNVSNTRVNFEVLSLIIRSCSNIQHLFLCDCRNIDNCNELVIEIASHLKGLKTLDLFRQKSVTAEAIISLAENCKNLVELDLGWCLNISVNTGCLQLLIKNCRQLKKLVLTAIRSVSNLELNAISEFSNKLEQLDVLGSCFITTEAVENVLKSCQNLKLLDISYCDKINKDSHASLKFRFPHVQIQKAYTPCY